MGPLVPRSRATEMSSTAGTYPAGTAADHAPSTGQREASSRGEGGWGMGGVLGQPCRRFESLAAVIARRIAGGGRRAAIEDGPTEKYEQAPQMSREIHRALQGLTVNCNSFCAEDSTTCKLFFITKIDIENKV